MKIQLRQSLYSSVAFGVVFIVISFFIYALYSRHAKKAVYKNLEKVAYIAAFFHLEEDELNTKEFEKVRKQFEKVVPNASYQLYDASDRILFGNKEEYVEPSVLQRIRTERYLSFPAENDFCYGIFYEDNQGDFIIITRESKDLLNDQLITLFWILLCALFVGLIAVILLSRWLAGVAYRPFSHVIEQVKQIPADNPGSQIDSPETKDELQELTETFNHLLKRISETFLIQQNFVSYVSHEFRTPLTAMLGNLEVFSIKDRTADEYGLLSNKLIDQIRQLESILNTLIVISDLRKNSDINSSVRIDELIWEIIEKLSVSYVNCKINVEIDILSENKTLLVVNKDRTQLLMALFNIIENAVKYSQGKMVNIRIYQESDKLCISVRDQGIGIPAEELDNISNPFYRANNTNQIQGSGIGLSIALRVLEKNKIRYRILSEERIGTTVVTSFD